MARVISAGQAAAQVTAQSSERSDSAAVAKQEDVLHYGRDDFRTFLIRPDKPDVQIDSLVETLTWTEPQGLLEVETGSLALTEPAYREGKIKVWAGHQIRLEWAPERNASFEELWTMRVYEPELALETWARTVQLKNEAALLELSEDDFNFKPGSKHKKGWLNKEVIRNVAGRYGLTVAGIEDFNESFLKGAGDSETLTAGGGLYMSTSPLDMIVMALQSEAKLTDKKFTSRIRGTTLTVAPVKATAAAKKIGPALLSAALTQRMPEHFTTAVTVRGASETKKGKDKRGHVKARLAKSRADVGDPPKAAPLDTHPTQTGT